MSDIMQAKYPRQYQSSKFAEGRLKLSTSCVECHRRKQKCDRKQPCGHCSRRYPQPACIYRTLRDISSSKDTPEPEQLRGNLATSEYGGLRDPIFQSGDNESNGERSNSWSWRITPGPQQEFIHNEPDLEQPSISIETLENFSAEDYQRLLTTMVSQISSTALAGAEISEPRFLEESRGGQNKSSEVHQGIFGKDEPSSQIVRLKNNSYESGTVPPPSNFSASSVDPLHFLGITPTVQSAELLQAFLKLIAKYVVSIDGNPSPNYYNDYWVPWSVKSPLLAHLGIFTAACYQAETQKIQPTKSAVVLRYKVKSIELLNEMLSKKETSTCDEAITGVIYLLVNEWYWNNSETVQKHMRGLKEMVRLRGGLDDLGRSGYLRKIILLTDYNIACSYDIDPAFPHNISGLPPHPVEMSMPFVTSQEDFNSIAEKLQITIQTAAILDDMRFLILALVNQVNRNLSEQEEAKLATTSIWIRDRIISLPDGSATGIPLAANFVYTSCRIAALIYCKAIVERTSLSKVCTLQELNHLWANMWQIKLSRWKQIPGIFLFIILSALPASKDTPHGRFLKNMFKTTSAYLGMDHWELVDAALMAFVKLQKWLRTGDSSVVRSSMPAPLDFIHIYRN